MPAYRSAIFFILFLQSLCEVNLGCCNLVKQPVVETVQKVLYKKNVSRSCAVVLESYVQNLRNESEDGWASKMLDATSKLPVGLVSYTFGDLGHFHECVKVESKNYDIKGKYCLGNIMITPSGLEHYTITQDQGLKQLITKIAGSVQMLGNPTWSLCLPSNCTDQDFKFLMMDFQPFGVGIDKVECQTIEDVYPKLTRDALIGISTLSFLLFLILVSTSYDIYCLNKGKAHPALISFSLYTNGKKLFSKPLLSTNLNCLDGIRVLSMIWIIILHTWTVYTSGPIFNSKDVVDIKNSIISMILINGDLACDTFLFVSGMLVTYVYFKKRGFTDFKYSTILRHYLHRIIRLTPSLAGVVLVSATLLRYMGSGPKWPSIVNYFEGFCKKHWWSTLLYVQNQVNVGDMCVGHSWYLDVDMQLYLFSPIIFWILSKYLTTGIGFIVLATISSITLGFFRAFNEELSAIHPNSYSRTPSFVYMNNYYLRTETRAAPWLMGTILGYVLTKKQFTEVSLPKKINLAMWILTLGVILLCVFGGFSTLRGPDYDKLQNAFYIALVRPSFALAMAWIIWACSTNHGGIVNSILCLPLFRLLNKFIYSMYLVHVTTLYMIINASKTALYINIFNLAYWFWGIFMFTFGISIIWVLIFESPMIALEKLILTPIKVQQEDCKKQEAEEKA